jgi:hypothetical protein
MGSINAKSEFLNCTEGCKIIAADISFGDRWDEGGTSFKLKPLHTIAEYEELLKFLDREYSNGYGGQELFGIIYCEDGIWIDRGEYDGTEWWNLNRYPDMRNSFDEVDVIKYERNKKLKIIENIL